MQQETPQFNGNIHKGATSILDATTSCLKNAISFDDKLQIKLFTGEELCSSNQTEVINDVLARTLDNFASNGIKVGKSMRTVKANHQYIMVQKELGEQTIGSSIFPFGPNLATCLTLLAYNGETSDTAKKQLFKQLTSINKQVVHDIVVSTLLKYYKPENGILDAKIINDVYYETLENNEFNLMVKFTIPLANIATNFQQALDQHTTNFNYNTLTTDNLLQLFMNHEQQSVGVAVTLY